MEITYEQLKKANDTIKTTDIKGKDYAEVNQRIKAFRMIYPQGFIKTEMISNDNGVCIFKATVGNADVIFGTGTAYEKENSTFINKTSYIENCETSAVGRALGMAGFGIDTSVASYEEVVNAIENQKEKKSVTKKVVKQEDNKNAREELIKYCKERNLDMNEIAKQYKLNSKSKPETFSQVLWILEKTETEPMEEH